MVAPNQLLHRYGLVQRRRRRRYAATGTGLSQPTEPNVPWCADYTGEFMLANRRYCYPLTITDFASRYTLYGLSKLAVWWLRLGIHLKRITLGHPQQTGGTSGCI